MKKLFSGLGRKIVYLLILGLFMGILNYSLISWLTSKENSFEINDVPEKKVALVLGTSEFLKNGSTNLYFKFRVEAVARLWKAGKIKYVLVSGDNSKKDYDEPSAMKEALIERGVPANRIVLDYAGFRTLDSVVRAKEVFGQDDILIVSQQFHVERALILADFKGIEAYGYNAVDVEVYSGFKTKVREYFARIKLWLDLVVGVDPKFLGEPVSIP
ncbi:SanA/YdcF family protein [Croceimicrobium hydrocarbonivorans]|uniref:YdcF family protein n=1 Tax=Croceimicrobium hydrocarbonivorans TaxID=2761580 RepID=A0A7H0VD28_9FLAO|nr:ElyC/SanA/YdcF family protein [Croceimicrobium hydrocarbonivorans]QNR23626.1 YdcF family protein [Croceimicrobium hydrocarbonivorans]